MKKNKPKYLFMLDLDGTVLASSTSGAIHPLTKQAIKKATKLGHIVCLVTGRP